MLTSLFYCRFNSLSRNVHFISTVAYSFSTWHACHNIILKPETHTKRQATQHGCLPSLLGDGDKVIEIVCGEKIFCAGPTRAVKAEQNLLYRHDKPNEPSREGPLSSVLFESPFTSVSTFSRGHPSLVSMFWTHKSIYSFQKYICRHLFFDSSP
jgi:hypothetical protein